MSYQQIAGPVSTWSVPPPPPPGVSFIFQVKVVRALHFTGTPYGGREIPPLEPSGYGRWEAHYFRWTPSAPGPQITRVAEPERLTEYGRPYSVFIQGDPPPGPREEYWVLGTVSDVTEPAAYPYSGWREVLFDHIDFNANARRDPNSLLRTPYPDVHNMSYICLDGEKQVLAAPGSPDWMPELLPRRYDYRPANAYIPTSGGICGKIALILALVVLSCPPTLMETILTRLRWGGRYLPHGDQTSRGPENHDRVAIVTLFHDFNCQYSRMDERTYIEELKKLESGRYGPIFC